MMDFSEQAAECERRAIRCRSDAVDTMNPILRDLIFDIEEHWRALANSYKAAQRAVDAAGGKPLSFKDDESRAAC
jgi:hypothetical protein